MKAVYKVSVLLLMGWPLVAATPIAIGQSVVPLNRIWKFHTGDYPKWAAPQLDDSTWEAVDLTPLPGAHDGDVGLSGYVPGWVARGHSGYSGCAWYRMHLEMAAPPGEPLALAGPADVDDAYQMFFNGTLLGSAGDFSGHFPTVYSIQPRVFALPNAANGVIALRVWMDHGSLESADAGGVHIAPLIGTRSGIEARYRLQWLQTVSGYIVDAVEPLVFILLAGMACTVMAFDRKDQAYPWLAVALLLTALVRANQAFFFWTQLESVHTFSIVKNVILVPTVLGTWAMAWRAWFRIRQPAWIPWLTGACTVLYMASQLEFHRASGYLRMLFLLLIVFIVSQGIKQEGREGWLALPAVILIGIGLFAQELSMAHIPSIWFPFGTGVSRTQFAYAAWDVVMFLLLLRRLLQFSKTA